MAGAEPCSGVDRSSRRPTGLDARMGTKRITASVISEPNSLPRCTDRTRSPRDRLLGVAREVQECSATDDWSRQLASMIVNSAALL